MERQGSDFNRSAPRRPARLAASAERSDGTSADVVVSNISYTGCEIASGLPFVRGETVRLFLPDRGQVHAQIRWVRPGRAGAKFLTGDSVQDARRARIGV